MTGTQQGELNRCARTIMMGSFAEAKTLIADAWLPERYKRFLTSLADFESGQVYVPGKVRWYEWAGWYLYTSSAAGPKLFYTVMRAVFFVLGLLGLRQAVVERILDREGPNLVHYRYTSFIKGLFYAMALYVGTPRKQRLYRAVLRSQISHHAALSGRFDVAERCSLAAVAELEALDREANGDGPEAIKDLIVWGLAFEAITNLFMIYVYMGDHEKKDAIFRKGEAQLARHEYLWLRLFYRIVGLHSTTEKLDELEMSRFASDLMKILGANLFQTRFALRLSGYTALMLAFQGDYFNAQTQILKSEELYRTSPVPLERARHHYTRALTELELQRFDKALHHAEKNIGMLAPVQGSIFHTVEARLMWVEVLLRSVYVRPDISNRDRLIVEASRELRTLRGKVKGSIMHDLRVRVLSLFVQYLRGDYEAVKEDMPRLREAASRVSKRYEKVLSQLQPTANQIASPTLSEDEILHKQSAYVIDQLSTLRNAENLHERSQEIVRKIFGTQHCKLVVVRQATVQIKDYAVTFQDGMTELAIPIGPDLYRFEIVGSAISAEFLGIIEPFLKLFSTLLNVIQLQHLEREKARLEAIEKTTQMLAHDVRKPFSMLKVGLDRMAAVGDDPAEARALAVKIREHVGKAFEHVNGMLADVMEVSSGKSSLQSEPYSPRALIGSALAQVFRYDANCHITFDFDLTHTSLLNVDQLKIQRVFANILDNARQATKGRGRIWIRSKELVVDDLPMIEITMGNSDSLIPPEALPKLFEAFFTTGKRGGTGLGLAICQKLVVAHGGIIRCQSSPGTGTEFIFTLPVNAGSRDMVTTLLPASSDEVRRTFEIALKVESATVAKPDLREAERREFVIDRSRRIGRPLEVLVIDDEALYVEGIKAQLERDPEIVRLVKTQTASSPREALAACELVSFDLVICDIDLGEGEISGYELVGKIRQVRPDVRICMHSNRSSTEDYRIAVEAGADAFLPKPMSIQHLLGLLGGAGKTAERRAARPVVTGSGSHLRPVAAMET